MIHENSFENVVCEMAAIFSMGRWVNITVQWRQDMPLGWSLDSLLMLISNETSKGNTGGYLSVTQNNDFYSWLNKSCVDKFIQWYNNGSNGHLFYVGVDLMMRRSMLPIIMLPDGDLRIALHSVPVWILTVWGIVHLLRQIY